MRHVPGLIEGSTSILPLRISVGILLFSKTGQVWIGQRKPKWAAETGRIWQMPQGGIERFETPRIAALRELREETGVVSVEVAGELSDWLTYELPRELVGIALKGRYRGQRQKWFAMRFLGDDDEIDIGARSGLKPEFEAWRWAPPEEVTARCAPFKRQLYSQVLEAFAPAISG